MRVRGLIGMCLFVTCAMAQVQKSNVHVPASAGQASSDAVEMKADPSFHSELDNASAKIFHVEVASHQSTEVDIHAQDYVVLSLGKSSFKVVGLANSFPVEMAPGEMQVLKGGWPQRLVNTSDVPLDLVEVEAENGIDPEHPECGLTAAECRDGEFGDGFTFSTLFETRKIKLTRIDLGPGGVLPKHAHIQSHVLVALADMKLSNQDTDKDAENLQLKAGEIAWHEGPEEHTLTNTGDKDAPIIVVEFKE